MIIRWGNYTVYKGAELSLKELRKEAPVPDADIQYCICYRKEERPGQLTGFSNLFSEDEYCKVVALSELGNAFWVSTFGSYNGNIVKVFEYKPDPEQVYVTTEDPQVAIANDFLDMGDHYGKDISLKELEKLWEERTNSEVELPLPSGLEATKDVML